MKLFTRFLKNQASPASPNLGVNNDLKVQVEQDTTAKVQSDLSLNLCESIQAGILGYQYKGVLALKCPFDLAIYTELIYTLRPRTILEFGSNKGGSALWFADTAAALGVPAKIVTADIVFAHEFQDERIEFRRCDISNISSYLNLQEVSAWPKPLLVIDDASHMYRHSLNILEFFESVSKIGDYIVVEDGIISVMNASAQYGGGPHRAIREFIESRSGKFEIDRHRCDKYGFNVTWNVDGYIKRVA